MLIGIYAGRFQPFHLGHFGAINHITQQCEETYVMICSRKGKDPWDDRNPFTYEERVKMMRLTIGKGVFGELNYRHICDQESDEEWARVIEETLPQGKKVCFTNNPKTRKAFRENQYQVNPIPIQAGGLNATGIRKLIIRNEPWQQHVPYGTKKVISDIQKRLYSAGRTD